MLEQGKETTLEDNHLLLPPTLPLWGDWQCQCHFRAKQEHSWSKGGRRKCLLVLEKDRVEIVQKEAIFKKERTP